MSSAWQKHKNNKGILRRLLKAWNPSWHSVTSTYMSWIKSSHTTNTAVYKACHQKTYRIRGIWVTEIYSLTVPESRCWQVWLPLRFMSWAYGWLPEFPLHLPKICPLSVSVSTFLPVMTLAILKPDQPLMIYFHLAVSLKYLHVLSHTEVLHHMTSRVTQGSPQVMGKANINGVGKPTPSTMIKVGKAARTVRKIRLFATRRQPWYHVTKTKMEVLAQLVKNLDTWHSNHL